MKTKLKCGQTREAFVEGEIRELKKRLETEPSALQRIRLRHEIDRMEELKKHVNPNAKPSRLLAVRFWGGV